MHWWNQFPPGLRLISKIRLLASLGAGGVIYLTPLVFNQIELSATQIGTGFAAAALTGTFSRFLSGVLLDKGRSIGLILKGAACLAITADWWFFNAQDFNSYAIGQVLLGGAAGLYWPAIELAVPASCIDFPSSKGFALVRSADALGTSFGALLGSFMALIGSIRITYLVDISCMVLLLALLTKQSIKITTYTLSDDVEISPSSRTIAIKKGDLKWLFKLIPILCISIFATAIFSLLQSALPIDLVIGGISRPPIQEGWSAAILALQLGLLVIFQWPIGNWLSFHKQSFGLGISISNFFLGCLLLSISSIWPEGISLVLIAQIFLAIALASFLPTATESIVQVSPIKHRGFAMALFSQCFAISGLIAPIFAGKIIDSQGNGMLIWMTMSLICLALIPLTRYTD
ncbi:MAG: MFS transporter [Prochlorococcaceae cyanobacterium ETNP1_MAG_9]|nr:MFS transporter [Prochlorococcaceae cyanobacterium ETNP1_MAG_9]